MDDKEKLFPASKKISIGATSSLVDLKAELFKRKQAAAVGRFVEQNVTKTSLVQPKWKVMADKLESQGKLKEIRRDPASRNNLSKLDREAVDADEHLADNLRKSREALERKSRLYDQRYSNAKQGTNHDSDFSDDDNDDDLIDFRQKVRQESSSSRRRSVSPTPAFTIDDDSDWVEFTDSLGRTRKCLRKDLDHYQSVDKETAKDVRQAEPNNPIEENAYEESQEHEEVKEVKPVRYQDMQENEVRQHGVGYFSFSADDDERRKQLNLLESLRDQTKKQRDGREVLKAKRKQALNERLAKVAARKGVPFVPKESSSDESDVETFVETDPGKDSAVLSRKEDHAREWDVGKRDDLGRTVKETNHISEHDEYVAKRTSSTKRDYSNFVKSSDGDTPTDKAIVHTDPVKKKLLDTKSYVEKSREERDEAFAPPSNYFFDDVRPPRPSGFQNRQSSFKPKQPSASFMPPKLSCTTKKPSDQVDVNDIISEKLAFFRSAN